MPIFYTLTADQQATLALIIALYLSDGLNENQLNILGNFIEAVGQNLLLIQAVVSSALPTTSSCNACQELIDLRTRIEALEKLIKKTATEG